MPASVSQQRRNPTIAVSAILPGLLDHISHQEFFVCWWDLRRDYDSSGTDAT
jgi:hypothetical protein